MSELIIRPIDIDKDAEGLAVMWNESDLQWPGSWTDGVPSTAEWVRELYANGRYTEVYVAEVEGKIVGWCSFMDGHHGQEGEGYLALLNVHPGYQKQSIGRKLIQATIERSVQEGWKRQTLGTWSANFKAVPTYKKTGHFWTPDTSVWMQNFIPGALQLSLAKPFFAKHHWYSCYVRDLDQEWDDQRWEGLKVFTQHWKADGESLTIWIDREARAPVAVDTDVVQVAAILSDIEPLNGSAVNLTWRVINKGQAPMQVYLHALGDTGLEIDHRDAFTVPAGETIERIAAVKVGDEAPRSKDDGAAPAVRSIIRLNDQEVELFSGMRPRKPLSLDTDPGEITVAPARPSEIKLQLHSELKEEAEAKVYITPPAGLAVDWTTREVTIPASGHVALPLTVTVVEECVYELPVRVERQGGEPVAEALTVMSVGAGGMLVHRAGGSVRIETDTLRVNVAAKEAVITVEEKVSQLSILSTGITLGPPYWPSEFQKKNFDLTVEQKAGRVVAHLAAEAKNYPGLYLHGELTFSPTGLGALRCYLENRGSQPFTKQIRIWASSSDRSSEQGTLPLAGGLVQSPGGIYPIAWDNAPRDPAQYAEPWCAWERDGAVAGLAWDQNATITRLEVEWRYGLSTAELMVAPGERSPEARMAFYAGRGDWQDARQILLGWAGVKPKPELAVRPVYQARLEPAVIATVAEDVKARLVVDTASNAAASGEVRINAEDGLVSSPEVLPVVDLARGHGVSREVTLQLPRGACGVFHGQVQLDLPLSSGAQSFRVLRLGTGAEVQVCQGEQEGQEVWTMANGANEFRVAPGFGPSLIAWNRGGVNQLYSYFPQKQGWNWVYPSFAGLHALLVPAGMRGWEGYLHKERFTAQAIEAQDAAGLLWRGVRLSGRPERQEIHDLQIELDYLTLGEANVLKHIFRLRNLRPTEQKVMAGGKLYCRLGGEVTDLVACGEGITRRPTPWATSIEGQSWGALVNPQTGRTMLITGRQNDIYLYDGGQHGRLIGAEGDVRLAGDETKELVYYLVLADSLEQAREYLALRDYQG